MPDNYLAPGETARALGLSTQRLRQPDMDMRLRPTRLGRTRVYSRDAVDFELGRRAAARVA